MPKFQYRARDSQGLLVTGEMEAKGVEEMKIHLSDNGLIPLMVKSASYSFRIPFLKNLFQQKIRGSELLVFTRQFYTLFKAGMGMENLLGTLTKQASNKRLKDAIQRIRSRVSSGESLSKAFANYPDIFGDLYISMLSAGEEAGILEEVLNRLSGLLEKEMEIKSSVKSAILYPKIVIFVLVCATFVIMTVVVPKFSVFFSHYHATLPLPTRMLMGFSYFMQNYSYVVVLVAGAIWFVIHRYGQTARGKIKIGALRFQMPVFGPLTIKVANARFCHILAALYRSGLPMDRSLEITGATIENGAFLREVDTLKSAVSQGRTISEGMSLCKYFTPVIVDATAVGEKTGSLDEMLDSIGNHYDLEVQHTIKNLTTLLEPILLFGIFGMVTVFVLAIFLPIWNMSKVVSGH